MNDSWIREAERPFVRRAEDWAARVDARGSWVLTDFLSPREQMLALSVGRREGLFAAGWGGYEGAERQRMLLMPGDWQPQHADFQVAALVLEAQEPLAHGAVLGSLLGTGVDRRKVGDIAVLGAKAYVAVCRDLVPHLQAELRQVGRSSVSLTPVNEALAWPPTVYEPVVISVASLRLDTVVAQACHWSRGRAQAAVEAGQVSLNHTPCEHPDEVVQPGDTLSVRGFGRIRILQRLGTSKKERERLEVGVLRSRT
ncbi:hypothetical protein JI721_00945 [Alicyclobacillus cycloheptanicus]|uniref:RNA-binding protein YlmH n=1 Tax=Alicyclobacillus cycloheptanicus TaxID=1457 RepID=A0ABT9XL06_9BACL|nr:YlmH/Sll1252 family protein [Alicyclobacillus cycloheptanicus]MDQ0190986.1 RNA-binding protein YlmH [Alicyclobacillus cycloheptanicus]WDM01487.1 hypothetical protein JI721_00945 [Alicyclobacillus cycloheptanicus]